MSRDRNISGKIGLAVSQYAKEGEYWLSKFSGDFKKTGFPYDHSPSFRERQEEQQKKDVIKFQLTRPCASTLVELSKGLDHRLFMILSAGLVALLHKYTDSKDITIGSPILKQETEGDFINTVLALRIQWDRCITFRELLLNRVRQTIVEADKHQNYPIEALLHQLNMSFSQFPFPLFDVAILLENIHEKEYIRHTCPTIIFSFLRTDDGIEGVMEYHKLLFDKNTAARIAVHFKRLVEEIVFNVNVPVSEIDILGEDEKRQLLFDFNATQTDYPAKQTIDELFEEQVSRKPAEIAVTYEGEPVSYKALNEEAGQLAAYLRSIGVKPGEPVALMAENSYRVITAVLGILKAGGAYVPLNAAYPEERKKYILNDCNVNVLLTNFREALAGDHYDYIPYVIDLENSGIT
jgi:non-ribosomal peptide synthetase component F